jgi:hypothetical protein
MRALAAVLLLLAACDFVSDRTSPSSDGGGASGGGDGGGGAVCEPGTAWELAPASATALVIMDAPPVATGRSARVEVTSELADCEERAMPEVEVDTEELTATIRLRVWRQVEGECAAGAGEITRPVVMQLPEAGSWTISADGAEPLKVTVELTPAGACGGGGGQCERDCDCDPGERCLRSVGVGGAHNACFVACELDRDCGGHGICSDIADGLDRVCALGDECNQQGNPACPAGYSCDLDSDTCNPSFTLNQESRGACTCDADCEEPLRCVRGRSGDDPQPRCQLTCQTGGPWCQGAHVCGAADEDAAGLATTDSVCGWLGE